MIQMPKRSVTRFFIPLIDVLILLFCIFLLLPVVQATDESGNASAPPETQPAGLSPAEREELQRLRQRFRDLERVESLTAFEKQELARLQKEKLDTLQRRLAIRVLEIDADTGKLFEHTPDHTEIASEAQARGLIERQKHETLGHELYYLFLFPRRVTGYPEERQIKQYERWFEGIAHGFENPSGQ